MTDDTQTPQGDQKTFTQADLEAAVAKAVEEATAGLKGKNAELLSETKAEREKRQALEKAQEEAEAERKKQSGEFKELYEKALADLKTERENAATYRATIQKRDIEAEAASIGSELTRDTARAAILREQAQKFAKLTDQGVSYEIGGVAVERTQVIEHLRTAYPFLVDGNQANGGGASGNSGGAAGRKLSEMSEAELVKLHKENPAEFKRLAASG